ncbi:hypothetical protein K504DRAFT_393979 [Pleomassaria siparia CBS 279.74]|uniref:Integral membrane protein n=1 Tax=Pleomassaria siparia CBS 279.74 TaxID=1314801 RepID=A0A6G1JR03_9PLEO|nr:hypothetical protein K504DRAFT_393979 [Pleomassaria siparia CBS 279.74]
MTAGRVFTTATAALLLGFIPLVVAHGEKQNDGPAQVPDSPLPQSYWRLSEHVALMYWHIGLEMLAWVVVLPVGVMLSIARSPLTLPIQFLFLVVNALALVLGVAYNHKTPELYANNAHSKIGWIITWITFAWVLMAVIQTYAGWTKSRSLNEIPAEQITTANMAQYQRIQNPQLPNPSRWSNDSGQGTERNSASLCATPSPSLESEDRQFPGPMRRYTQDEEDVVFDDEAEKRGFLQNTSVDRFLTRHVACFAGGGPLKIVRFLYVVVERTAWLQGLVAIASGTIVYGGIGHGGAIFNVMAHYVKGGIFFAYGFLTLGRWTGAFADCGWAWNLKPPMEAVGRRKFAVPSAEFTESFLFFLYGITNVWMEHMAAWGGPWTAQDLEHVSISIMFFGGGLLGMLIESKKMRSLLNTEVISQQPAQTVEDSWQHPTQYRFSMNPMPGLVVLLLGKMMSSHHQNSMLSAMIHAQWGGLFMGIAASRAITYIIMYISPPTSYLPSRPPSEIITAFCMISGGLTFIISNKDTVAALEAYNLDAMFVFTVTTGVTSMIMAWITVLMAIKGWAIRKANASLFAKINAGVLA